MVLQTYDFNNVMLVPRECVLESRSQADVSAKLGKRTFKIPLMASNMPSIINESIAVELAKRDYFYVMHRFGIDVLEFVRNMTTQGLFVSISVGIKPEWFDFLVTLKQQGFTPEYITIDISHGHNKRVKPLIEHIRNLFGHDTFIIAGNVATPQGVMDLESWGADAVKVGIGPGHVCTTSPKTGFGTRGWQLSAIHECAKVAKKVVVADGGVANTGDIAKAIYMGAHWVMSGYLFSGLVEGPGAVITRDSINYKTYYGTASLNVKMTKRRVEGKETLVEVKMTLFEKLVEVEDDLQSSVSFAGGTKLEDIKKVDHVFVNLPSNYF